VLVVNWFGALPTGSAGFGNGLHPCRYGGQGPWLLCPACLRKMAVLYLGGASALSFSCRRCAKLKYDSQRSGLRLRLMRKAQKLRRKLGGSGSLWKPFPEKPRTMQWNRYERVKEMARKPEEEWAGRLRSLFVTDDDELLSETHA
jgi:hypothetical protein